MVYLINWLLSKTLSIDSEIKTWWIPNMKYFPSQSARCVFVTKQVHNSIGRTAVWLYSFILKLFSSSLTRSCCMHSEMLRLMFAFFYFCFIDAICWCCSLFFCWFRCYYVLFISQARRLLSRLKLDGVWRKTAERVFDFFCRTLA